MLLRSFGDGSSINFGNVQDAHEHFLFVRSVSGTHSAIVTIGQRDELRDPTTLGDDVFVLYAVLTVAPVLHAHASTNATAKHANQGGKNAKENLLRSFTAYRHVDKGSETTNTTGT